MDGVIYPGCRVLCVVAKQNKPVPAPFKMKKKRLIFLLLFPPHSHLIIQNKFISFWLD